MAKSIPNPDSKIDSAKQLQDNKKEYTLIVSGLVNGGRKSIADSKNTVDDLLILFDVVEDHRYSLSAEKTDYSIESKAKASDHMIIKDGEFSFSARVTDSPFIMNDKNYIDKDTDYGNPKESKRPAKALEILKEILETRQMVTLVTEDNILENYVFTKIDAQRTTDEGGSLVFDFTLSEFRLRDIGKTVLAKTADPKKAGNAQKGAKQTAEGGAVDDANKGKKTSRFLGKAGKGYQNMLETVTGDTSTSYYSDGSYIYRPNQAGPTGFNPNSLGGK